MYQVMSIDQNNTLHEVMELQQKFDVLAEKMGVVIVGSLNGEEPKIVSVCENGMLGDATAYIAAAQVADRIMNIQHRCLQEQARLFDQLERKRWQEERKREQSPRNDIQRDNTK